MKIQTDSQTDSHTEREAAIDNDEPYQLSWLHLSGSQSLPPLLTSSGKSALIVGEDKCSD
jgi:hypothetical protein